MSGRALDEQRLNTPAHLNPYELYSHMRNVGLTFDFINSSPVALAFLRVNERIRTVLYVSELPVL